MKNTRKCVNENMKVNEEIHINQTGFSTINCANKYTLSDEKALLPHSLNIHRFEFE